MNRILPAAILLASALLGQQTGAIHGTLRDGSGEGLAKESVRLSGPQRSEAATDSEGRYEATDLPPGRYRVASYTASGSAHKIVTLAPGGKVENVDLRIEQPGAVQGRVLDQNGEPMAGVAVYLVGTEYRFGALRHTYRARTAADDRGQYRFDQASPGIRYVVLAKAAAFKLPAISDVPAKVESRRPAFQPTYYPASPTIESAERILLRAGEVREGVDIRMIRTASYCVEGVLRAAARPAALQFTFSALQPSSGAYADGGVYTSEPSGKTGPDGAFRICDLAPGEYRMTAMEWQGAGPTYFAATNVVIVDRDVLDLTVPATPALSLEGELVWAGEATAEEPARPVRISLRPVFRTRFGEEGAGAPTTIPGEFSQANLWMEAYEVSVLNLPRGSYVAAVDYAGRSVLNEILWLGSAPAGSRLRVAIGGDGGFASVAVKDLDGEIASDATVFVLPETAVSEVDVATTMIAGRCDQQGVYVSEALRPGKYRILALPAPIDLSPESIRPLWLARPKATLVTVEPEATVKAEIKLLSP